ncbi:hypothetical protein Sango_2328300 [Sesamum angolense]|uniref:Uncharacterized protein n=1 Tax=Sesamum angolense TaxID=2727404 RepID=A0AAE2BLM0_9LAMI|nr:hypothetical protein Sango_2328300 [Sesamum angolense]
MLLQQQYREKGFTKHSELISCLLVAEQNNELLLKNHESRPIGSTPFPEVNVATRNHYNHESYCGCGRGHNHSRGRGYRGGHSKNYLSTRSGKMMKENLKRKTVGKLANMRRLHAIVVVKRSLVSCLSYAKASY